MILAILIKNVQFMGSGARKGVVPLHHAPQTHFLPPKNNHVARECFSRVEWLLDV